MYSNDNILNRPQVAALNYHNLRPIPEIKNEFLSMYTTNIHCYFLTILKT